MPKKPLNSEGQRSKGLDDVMGLFLTFFHNPGCNRVENSGICLRWLGHVYKRPKTLVERTEMLQVKGIRRRGKTNKTLH